ncbi:MAG TPA: glycosyltransferase [Bryobacteraceae bacterium]
MSEALSILYVGDLREGMSCRQRLRALKQLGHEVDSIDIVPPSERNRFLSTWSRITFKLYRMRLLTSFKAIDFAGANEAILNHIRNVPVDVIWIDSGRTIRAQTLQEVKKACPHCIILGYTGDDMMARHNQSSQFLEGLPLYDVFFTTKTFGVAELRALGCPRVHFTPFGFDPDAHFPISVSADEKKTIGGEVGFIGFYEEERARSMQFLASHGISVRIYGDGWKSQRVNECLRVEGRTVFGQDYVRTLCAFDINLGFLRRMSRDRQTCRSYEIPACGAFMLAERTDEHLELFKEGVEAEFFSSDQELLDKVRYYLAHPEERARIAAAGRNRCLENRYSYPDRVRAILETVKGECGVDAAHKLAPLAER